MNHRLMISQYRMTRSFPSPTTTAITLLLLLFCGQGQEHEETRVLAIYFKNIQWNTPELNTIFPEISQRLSKVFDTRSMDITLDGPHRDACGTTGSFVVFLIRGVDSASSPSSYSNYLRRWENALRTDRTLTTFLFEGHEIHVDSSRYEAADVRPLAQVPLPKPESMPNGKKLIGSGLTHTEMPIMRNDVSTLAKDRYSVMQLKLNNGKLDDYSKSFDNYKILVESLTRVAAQILGVPENEIIFFDIKEGSTIVQFTVHPASRSLDQLSQKWDEAISERDPRLSKVFDDVDFYYPSTSLTGVARTTPTSPTTTTATTTTTTTTTTAATATTLIAKSTKKQATQRTIRRDTNPSLTEADESNNKGGPSTRLVAGAVFGSLTGFALISGLAASIVHHKKRKNGTSAQVNQRKSQDCGEISPGGNTGSPGGLTNVDICGSTTPNPHNFH